MGLFGPDAPPPATRPGRLVVLETEGWAALGAATKTAFEVLLGRLREAGVALLRRGDHPFIEALERALGNARAVCGAVTSWENRWYQRALVDQHPDGVSARAKAVLERAEAMRPDDYRAALLERDAAQLRHAAIAPLADAVITLACPGPAPLWAGDVPGAKLAPRPTGDFVFNAPSSMLFAPAVTVPLLAVEGMPVGVQVMGQQHQDAAMAGIARWLLELVQPPMA
jgi:Asp-tRNA(Asn)/Glu-tRNA(Gln) amidotransferase A subunit family amidase